MAVTPLDAFRIELGDTEESEPLFNDTEAQYFLDKNPGNVLLAVADACDALARKFTRRADLTLTSNGDTVSRKWAAVAKSYSDRATDLRARSTGGGGAPWHGGGSYSRRQQIADDTDRVPQRFARGEFDAPGAR